MSRVSDLAEGRKAGEQVAEEMEQARKAHGGYERRASNQKAASNHIDMLSTNGAGLADLGKNHPEQASGRKGLTSSTNGAGASLSDFNETVGRAVNKSQVKESDKATE